MFIVASLGSIFLRRKTKKKSWSNRKGWEVNGNCVGTQQDIGWSTEITSVNITDCHNLGLTAIFSPTIISYDNSVVTKQATTGTILLQIQQGIWWLESMPRVHTYGKYIERTSIKPETLLKLSVYNKTVAGFTFSLCFLLLANLRVGSN